NIPIEYNELLLAWKDLTNALALEQFEDIENNISTLQNKINELNSKLTSIKKNKIKKHIKK
ncbi:MAG: hypothetical protein ACP5SG_03200, partial [Dissulfurimicrobium sp.]